MKQEDPVPCAYSKFPCKRESHKSSKDGYCIFHAKAEDKSEREFKKALKKYIEEGNYDFRSFVFVGDINFKKDFGVAVFKKADFGGASFQGGAYFGETEFRTRAFISPKCMKGDVSLVDAILENISLTPLNLDKSAQIDFTGARARNTDIRREDIEGHIEQERGKDFSKAKEIYLLLKNNFHGLGRYDDESWAFRKEKEMERKSFWHFRKEYKDKDLGEKWTNREIKDCFYPALLDLKQIVKFTQDNWFPNSWDKVIKLFSYIPNFLEQPGATIKSEFNKLRSFVLENTKERTEDVSCKEFIRALWIYIKYPLNYFWSTFLKYLYSWGEWPWLIFLWCGVTILTFSFLYCIFGNVVVTKDQAPLESYLNKLYFSGVTFIALSYGDYSPTGMAKPLAFLESFLGIFFIALFLFSFTRRTTGR